jgi:hypothetical protein
MSCAFFANEQAGLRAGFFVVRLWFYGIDSGHWNHFALLTVMKLSPLLERLQICNISDTWR